MASQIANSDVIAEVKFTSLESATKEHPSYGFVAELTYKFEVIKHLKGDGTKEIVVREIDGPSSDVIVHRSEEEVRKRAESWLLYSKAVVGAKQNAILFLRHNRETNEYSFAVLEIGSSDHLALGTSWLGAVDDSMYRHLFTDGEAAIISVADLKIRIEQLSLLTEGEYGGCVRSALYWRDRVRRQTLGTYREMTIAGFKPPEPFPRYEVALNSVEARSSTVFEFRRPPYRSPLFSDYWLDGEDKGLFAIETRIYPDFTYEAIVIAEELPPGTYSVHYSQYHESLPCSEMSPYVESEWWTSDTAEWVVNI